MQFLRVCTQMFSMWGTKDNLLFNIIHNVHKWSWHMYYVEEKQKNIKLCKQRVKMLSLCSDLRNLITPCIVRKPNRYTKEYSTYCLRLNICFSRQTENTSCVYKFPSFTVKFGIEYVAWGCPSLLRVTGVQLLNAVAKYARSRKLNSTTETTYISEFLSANKLM